MQHDKLHREDSFVPNLGASPADIAAFCKRHHIQRMSLFGSVLRDDFRPDSDVDVLIEFEPGCTPGLAIVDIEEELSRLLDDHQADIVNPKYLNARIKKRVLESARLVYAEG